MQYIWAAHWAGSRRRGRADIGTHGEERRRRQGESEARYLRVQRNQVDGGEVYPLNAQFDRGEERRERRDDNDCRRDVRVDELIRETPEEYNCELQSSRRVTGCDCWEEDKPCF